MPPLDLEYDLHNSILHDLTFVSSVVRYNSKNNKDVVCEVSIFAMQCPLKYARDYWFDAEH